MADADARGTIALFLIYSTVAVFAFTRGRYSVLEDVGNAPVEVTLRIGVLARLLDVTVSTEDFQAIGKSLPYFGTQVS